MCPVSLSTLLPLFVILPLFCIHLCLVSYSPPVYLGQCFPLSLWWFVCFALRVSWFCLLIMFMCICFLTPCVISSLNLVFWFALCFAFGLILFLLSAFVAWILDFWAISILKARFCFLSACLRVCIWIPFCDFFFYFLNRTQWCMSGQFSLMVETVGGFQSELMNNSCLTVVLKRPEIQKHIITHPTTTSPPITITMFHYWQTPFQLRRPNFTCERIKFALLLVLNRWWTNHKNDPM